MGTNCALVREMRHRTFRVRFRNRTSRFQKTGAADSSCLNCGDTNTYTRVRWILWAKQTFPVGAGGLTKPAILHIERISQSGNDFDIRDFPLKRRFSALLDAHRLILSRKQAQIRSQRSEVRCQRENSAGMSWSNRRCFVREKLPTCVIVPAR